jgi:hypothetical protein
MINSEQDQEFKPVGTFFGQGGACISTSDAPSMAGIVWNESVERDSAGACALCTSKASVMVFSHESAAMAAERLVNG